MKVMKDSVASSEYVAFKTLLNRITSVSREVIQEREATYKKQSALNPSKPGPKTRKGKSK
jgi:hypothetical protein